MKHTSQHGRNVSLHFGIPIEILVNPFSGDTTGLVRITAWQMADVGFAHGASFAKLKQA